MTMGREWLDWETDGRQWPHREASHFLSTKRHLGRSEYVRRFVRKVTSEIHRVTDDYSLGNSRFKIRSSCIF